jgi:hypothetical protein
LAQAVFFSGSCNLVFPHIFSDFLRNSYVVSDPRALY